MRLPAQQHPEEPRHNRMRPLGVNQRLALEALYRHTFWPSGWILSTQSEAVRVLDSLVRRGLVDRNERGTYRLSRAGLDLSWSPSPFPNRGARL